jgi:hypothetical protein
MGEARQGVELQKNGERIGEEEKEEGDDTWGPQVSEVDSRDVAGAFLSIQKYQSLQMGPKTSNTYKNDTSQTNIEL